MALDPEPGSPVLAAIAADDPGAVLTGDPADPGDPAAELVELPAAEPVPVADQRAAGVPAGETVTLAEQKAGTPAPDPPAAGEAPPAAEPVLVEPGRVYAYTRHDDYAVPPRDRHQLVLVVRVEGDGQVAGVPIAYADELAHFPAGELGPLDALDG